MAVKKNRKSKCIFFDFLGENLEIAPKQGKNSVEVVKVITFIRGVYEINNFIESQLAYGLLYAIVIAGSPLCQYVIEIFDFSVGF